MPAPTGNEFWKARSTHGDSPTFADPESLWDACCQYFDWVEQNPLHEEKIFCYQGNVVRADASKMRAMTIEGLCIFAGITSRTWRNYREKDDFIPIIERAEEIIRSQKFAGAAADLLNANIIARDLGLKDKAEVESRVEITEVRRTIVDPKANP